MLNTNKFFFAPLHFFLLMVALWLASYCLLGNVYRNSDVLASEYRGFVQYPSLGLNKTKKYHPDHGLVNEKSIQYQTKKDKKSCFQRVKVVIKIPDINKSDVQTNPDFRSPVFRSPLFIIFMSWFFISFCCQLMLNYSRHLVIAPLVTGNIQLPNFY